MEVIWFIGVSSWLFMGGWAFNDAANEPPKDGWGDLILGLFILCVLFGPFMFGAAWASKKK